MAGAVTKECVYIWSENCMQVVLTFIFCLVVHSPINVSVVTILRLVFNVGRVDGNLTGLFFGSTINVFVGHGIGPSLFTQDFGDGLCQCGLTVIDLRKEQQEKREKCERNEILSRILATFSFQVQDRQHTRSALLYL